MSIKIVDPVTQLGVEGEPAQLPNEVPFDLLGIDDGAYASSTTFYPEGQGPLAKALQNPYEDATPFLQYPRDLNSSRKSHSVQFQIYERKVLGKEDVQNALTNIRDMLRPSENFDETGIRFSSGDSFFTKEDISYEEQLRNAQREISESFQSATSQIISGEWGVKAKEFLDRASLQIRDTPSGLISLYMPDNIQFEYTAQYENYTLADAVGSAHIPLLSRGVKAITSTIDKGGNTAARALLNYAGYVFNPQQQTMFEGIDFRPFSMGFTFTPFSRVESDVIKKIIKKFRSAAAPTIVTSAAGFFFNAPSVFKIKFMYAGKENQNITKLKTCVLENVSVDYSPNGWTAFNDGSPVQITMALSFREVELVDRVAIQQGY